jgi:hypothetical protein
VRLRTRAFDRGSVPRKALGPAAHVRRVNRPDTWQHRLASQHAQATLANGEPSTHGSVPTFRGGPSRIGWYAMVVSLEVDIQSGIKV